METIKSVYDGPAPGGFAHVANIGGMADVTAYDFGDGLTLRGANASEIQILQAVLQDIPSRAGVAFPPRNCFEQTIKQTVDEPDHSSYVPVDLPESDWRYFVISFTSTNAKYHDLVRASMLTTLRLERGTEVMATPGMGTTFGGVIREQFWDDTRYTDEPLRTVDATLLNGVRDVYHRLKDFDHSRFNLLEAMTRFEQLDRIPTSSPLLFLGYVSVLESLIAHQPKSTDHTDSLGRQIRGKMKLLSNRAVIPIPYALFDPSSPPDTVWRKLYDYRSAIAHGSAPSFSSDFQLLRDANTAVDFIRSSTVSVMRQAFEEPQLVADLRNC